MNFDDLKLSSGYPVQLQVAAPGGKSRRLNCRFIGSLPGKGIILTLPNARLMGGQKLAVRIMIANGMCVFSASVESQLSSPFGVLFLSYPQAVNFKRVRNASRVETKLVIQALNQTELESQPVSGLITDISTTGARLELKSELGKVGDRLQIQTSTSIGGVDRKLQLEALIRARIERSTREYDEQLPAVYGVEFVESCPDRLLQLYAYVYVEMADDDRFEQS